MTEANDKSRLVCATFEKHNILEEDDPRVEDNHVVDEDELFDQANYDGSFLKCIKEGEEARGVSRLLRIVQIIFSFGVVSIKVW